MDAHAALGDREVSAASLRPHASCPFPWVAPLAAWLLMGLLLTAALLLCLRRGSGAILIPPPPLALVALGIVLACASLLFRRAALNRASTRPLMVMAGALPLLTLALLLCAVVLPGTSGLGLAALVGVVLLEEGWSWGRRVSCREGSEPTLFSPTEAPPEALSRQPDEAVTGAAHRPVVEGAAFRIAVLGETTPEAALSRLDGEADERDESISQQIVRRNAGSGEVLDGFTRVEFSPGQRVAAAHLAICPPLASLPACYAEPADGPGAQVRVTNIYTHGVRVEVKLDQPAEEPASVLVEFSIQEHPDEHVSQRR